MIFREGEWARPAGEGIFDNWVPLGDLSLGKEYEFQERLPLHQILSVCSSKESPSQSGVL